MRKLRNYLLSSATAVVIASLSAGAQPAAATQPPAASKPAASPAVSSGYEHVLLISVDGMHAVDLANWIQNNPNSNSTGWPAAASSTRTPSPPRRPTAIRA